MRRLAFAALAIAAAGCESGGGRSSRDLPVPSPAVSGAIVAAPADADVSRPLTLAECVRIALSKRGIVRRAELAVLTARDRVDETFAQILPRVTLDMRGESRTNDRGAVFDGEARVTGDRTVGTAGISVIVPTYDFGGSRARIDAAESRARAAEHDTVRTRNDLALSVARAYYRVLESRRVVEVVADSLRTVESQLAIARDFEKAGLVARSDVLTAEVQLARRRQESIAARSNADLALETLNRVTGFDLARPTRIVDVLETSVWDGPLGTSLAAAAERRPELAALAEQVRAARAEHEAASAEQHPGIYAFANADHTSDSYTLNPDWVSAGVGLRWSLFDGWSAAARQRRTAEELRDLEEARDEAAEDVALEVRTAWRDVRDAAERVPVARRAIELATENLRVVRDQYGAGLVTTADLLVEEERLASARTSWYRALYDYHEAVARLGRAAGADPLAETGSVR